MSRDPELSDIEDEELLDYAAASAQDVSLTGATVQVFREGTDWLIHCAGYRDS